MNTKIKFIKVFDPRSGDKNIKKPHAIPPFFWLYAWRVKRNTNFETYVFNIRSIYQFANRESCEQENSSSKPRTTQTHINNANENTTYTTQKNTPTHTRTPDNTHTQHISRHNQSQDFDLFVCAPVPPHNDPTPHLFPLQRFPATHYH
jgi:hypothetical protein